MIADKTMDTHLQNKAVLIDMDGVLYRGGEAIPGAADFIDALKRAGNPFLYLTNNSDYATSAFVDKLADIGISATASEILSSAHATAQVLQAEIAETGTAYVIGGPGTHEALRAVGWATRDDESEPHGRSLLDPAEIDAVVIGEGYALTATRMEQAVNLVMADIPFFATNPDRMIPGPGGSRMLGCGSLYAGIEMASGRSARVVGKPEPDLYRQALARLGAKPTDAVMIGDRVDTDVAGAKRLGLTAILVLSGATTEAPPPSDHGPDLVVPSVAHLT